MKINVKRQAATIFMDAADYIKRYGWQVEGMGKHSEPRCSMGALASAYPAKKWEPELAQLMYQELQKSLKGMPLTEYNFAYQDPSKVIELFTNTAKALHEIP